MAKCAVALVLAPIVCAFAALIAEQYTMLCVLARPHLTVMRSCSFNPRTIYNMCTQKPPHDYSEALYNRYRDVFTYYINESVRCRHKLPQPRDLWYLSACLGRGRLQALILTRHIWRLQSLVAAQQLHSALSAYAVGSCTVTGRGSAQVMPSLRDQRDEQLLKELHRRWGNHNVMTRWLSRFFNYLDRYDCGPVAVFAA